MKKILICLSLIILVFNSTAVRLNADEDSFGPYDVTFINEAKRFESNYNQEEILKKLQGMQPGDKAEITFHLNNAYKNPTKWYMSNEATRPFEDDARNSVDGGNYTYRLTYVDGYGIEKSIYDSEAVGGDATEGLRDATNALTGMFALDTLNPDQTSTLKLYFELDGETQANNYQDVIGQIQVNFAVEMDVDEKPQPKPQEKIDEGETKKEVVKRTTVRKVIYLPYTGDEAKVNMYIAIECGLFVLLAAVVWRYWVYVKKQGAK